MPGCLYAQRGGGLWGPGSRSTEVTDFGERRLRPPAWSLLLLLLPPVSAAHLPKATVALWRTPLGEVCVWVCVRVYTHTGFVILQDDQFDTCSLKRTVVSFSRRNLAQTVVAASRSRVLAQVCSATHNSPLTALLRDPAPPEQEMSLDSAPQKPACRATPKGLSWAIASYS